jgi:hypothetical protein
MQAKKEEEKPLKSFILPNESYKWDFILEKYFVDESQPEVIRDNVGTKQLLDDGFDKDYIVTQKKRKRQKSNYY